MKRLYYAVAGSPWLVLRIRRWLGGKGVVLAYHNVRTESSSDVPLDPALHLPLDDFRWQVEDLASRYPIVTLERLLRGEAPSDAVALTFDDAYRGFVRNACHLLAELGIPSTVFVVSDAAGVDGRGFWWDEFALPLAEDSTLRDYCVGPLCGRYEKVAELMARRGHRARCFGRSEETGPADWEELRSLDPDLVEVGSHTVTHANLTRIPEAEIRTELEDSRRAIETNLRRPVRYLAYPYGEWNGKVAGMAKQAGYEAAFTLDYGALRSSSERYALPRISIPGGIAGSTFRAWAVGARPSTAPFLPARASRWSRSNGGTTTAHRLDSEDEANEAEDPVDAAAADPAQRPTVETSTPRIRLLHILLDLGYGGMQKLLVDIVRQLPTERYDIHILILGRGNALGPALGGHATLHQAPEMSPWSMVHPRWLLGFLRRIRPDVVHTHSGSWYKAALAARLAAVSRVVFTEHGRYPDEPLSHRIVDRMAAMWTTTVVAVGEAVAHDLVARVGVRPERIRIIPNGVDVQRFRPRPPDPSLRRELRLPPEAPVIGSVGRLHPVKRFDRLLRCFAALDHREIGHRDEPWLVLVGEGPELGALQRMAGELGVADRVMFAGGRSDVHRFYSLFEVFVCSSDSEGTALSVLEAMASGTPVAATEAGGNRALLADDPIGRPVPVLDEHALADRIALLLSDPAASRSHVQWARNEVISGYSLDQMASAYRSIYEPAG